jgi:hypothetical protein
MHNLVNASLAMNDPELFVVRIWRQVAADFRATARRVDDEETHLFSRPDELTRFLATPTQASAAADAAPEAAVRPTGTPDRNP